MASKKIVEKKEIEQEVEVKDISSEDGGIDDSNFLVPTERYLKTGAHIGTKFKHGSMRDYIFKKRKDNLCVLDVSTIDERIRLVAKFLSNYDASRIYVVGRKLYAKTPIKKFAEITGSNAVVGRFVPGTFTNPSARNFKEAEVVFVAEPESDAQAINEATKIKAPVVSLASTDNSLRNVDIVIPVNNKGRKSLALVYWLLAREILLLRGDIKDYDSFTTPIQDFEQKIEETSDKLDKKKFFRRRFRGKRR